MKKHPNDEFDRVPEFTDRKGIHRQAIATAGAGTRRSPLGWIVAFGIFALVVGLFSFFVLPQLTGQPVAAPPASSSSASQSPAEASDGAAESEATKESKDESGAAESSAAAAAAESSAAAAAAESAAAKSEATKSEEAKKSEAAAASSSSAAAAAPDTSTKVGVFNGSRRSGLAASGQAKLSAAGFNNLSAANWTKRVNSSIVYYKSDEDQATAEKAAAAMGINTVYKTSQIPGRVAVVLGADY